MGGPGGALKEDQACKTDLARFSAVGMQALVLCIFPVSFSFWFYSVNASGDLLNARCTNLLLCFWFATQLLMVCSTVLASEKDETLEKAPRQISSIWLAGIFSLWVSALCAILHFPYFQFVCSFKASTCFWASVLQYDSLEEGIQAVLDIWMDILQELISTWNFELFIHPIPPVLDPTRHIVTQFMSSYRKRVLTAAAPGSLLQGKLHWLGFFEDLLVRDGDALNPAYALDGTHLSPAYLELLQETLSRV